MLTHTLKEDAHTRRKNVINPERYNFLFRITFFQCFPEDKAREHSGFTAREYKCCSTEELSNTDQPGVFWCLIVLQFLQVQQFLLE